MWKIDGQVGGMLWPSWGRVLGPKANIGGQLVTVGGTNYVAEGGKVEGQIVEVGAGMGRPDFCNCAG
jgi:hypothetical protein